MFVNALKCWIFTREICDNILYYSMHVHSLAMDSFAHILRSMLMNEIIIIWMHKQLSQSHSPGCFECRLRWESVDEELVRMTAKVSIFSSTICELSQQRKSLCGQMNEVKVRMAESTQTELSNPFNPFRCWKSKTSKWQWTNDPVFGMNSSFSEAVNVNLPFRSCVILCSWMITILCGSRLFLTNPTEYQKLVKSTLEM